jgi:hypothetical protein
MMIKARTCGGGVFDKRFFKMPVDNFETPVETLRVSRWVGRAVKVRADFQDFQMTFTALLNHYLIFIVHIVIQKKSTPTIFGPQPDEKLKKYTFTPSLKKRVYL